MNAAHLLTKKELILPQILETLSWNVEIFPSGPTLNQFFRKYTSSSVNLELISTHPLFQYYPCDDDRVYRQISSITDP